MRCNEIQGRGSTAVPFLEASKQLGIRGFGVRQADKTLTFGRFHEVEKSAAKDLFPPPDFSYNHFTGRRKEVKPLTEGGRTVLLLFVTAAAASDLKWGRICNFLTLTSLAGGIWLLALHAPQEIPGVLGAMVLLACFLFPFWKIGGLGAGDIKMLMALVPYMGVRWFFFSIILSFLIGAVISAFLLIRYRDLSRTVHFAVPIGISVVLCLLLEQLSVQSPFLF